MGVVTRRKYYKCSVCRRDFARESALVNHTNLTHSNQKRDKQDKNTKQQIGKESWRKGKNHQSASSNTSLETKSRRNGKAKEPSANTDTIKIDQLKFKRGKPHNKKSLFIATKFLKIAKHRTTIVKKNRIKSPIKRESSMFSLKTSSRTQKGRQNSTVKTVDKSLVSDRNLSASLSAKSNSTWRRTTARGEFEKRSNVNQISDCSRFISVAADFGFSSVSEMFFGRSGPERGSSDKEVDSEREGGGRRMVLAVERMEVPEKMWFVIEEIEGKVAKEKEKEKQSQPSKQTGKRKPDVKEQKSEQVKKNRIGKRAVKRPRKFSFDNNNKDTDKQLSGTPQDKKSQSQIDYRTKREETSERLKSDLLNKTGIDRNSASDGKENAKSDSVAEAIDTNSVDKDVEEQKQQQRRQPTDEPEQEQRDKLNTLQLSTDEQQNEEIEKPTEDRNVTTSGIVTQQENSSNNIDDNDDANNAVNGILSTDSQEQKLTVDGEESLLITCETDLFSTDSQQRQQKLTVSENSFETQSEIVKKEQVHLKKRVIKKPKKFMDEEIDSSYVKKTPQPSHMLTSLSTNKKRKLEQLKFKPKVKKQTQLKQRDAKSEGSNASNGGKGKEAQVAMETGSQDVSFLLNSKDTSSNVDTINSNDTSNSVHTTSTNDHEGYGCDLCKRGFSRLAALEKHKKYSHAKQSRFPAIKPKITSKRVVPKMRSKTTFSKNTTSKNTKSTANSVNNVAITKKNQLNVSRNSSFKCSVCNKLFAKQLSFAAHMKSHNSVPCELCSQKFKDNQQLHKHKVKVHLEDPFSCNICTDTFLNSELLIAHVRLVHADLEVHAVSEQEKNKLNTFDCGECGKQFITEFRYNLHVAAHERTKFREQNRMFQCPQCTLTFRLKSNLTRHMSQTHKDRPHACKYCNKKYATIAALTVHQNSHSEAKQAKDALLSSIFVNLNENNDSKQIFCEMCNVTFSTLDHKKQHMTEIHGSEWTHLCLTCFKVFPNKERMLKHQIVHKNIQHQSVPIVSELVNDSSVILNEHSSNLTPLKSNYLSSSANETDYPSSVVSESANLVIEDEVLDSNQVNANNKETEEKLPQKHESQNVNAVTSNGEIEDVSKIDSIRCHVCKRKFKNHLLLNAHIQKNHMDSSTAPQYKCEICLESFGSFGQYNQHTRTHPETMLFACKFCNERFFTEKRLTQHTNTHHRDQLQEYQCKFCDELFDDYKEYSRHRKTHPEDDPYLCMHCGDSFSSKYSLKSHLPLHGIRVNETQYRMSCDFCFKVFPNVRKLNDHQRSSCPQIRSSSHSSENETTAKIQSENNVAIIEGSVKEVSTSKVWRCTLCLKKFENRSGLKWHEQLHWKDRRYPCELCGVGFGDNGDLARHRLEHRWDAEFNCFLCPSARFLDTQHLIQHEHTTHIQPSQQGHKQPSNDNSSSGPPICLKNFSTIKIIGQTWLKSESNPIDLVEINPLVADFVSRKWRELP